MKRKTKIRVGFTLVELLTTLAVIGILLGLLIPALNQVSKTATKVKQKAQFHAIGTALETFRNDYGDYPPSAWDADFDGMPDYGYYYPSQRLAEAIIGRDGLGFHPSSKFLGNGTDGTVTVSGNPLYYPAIAGFTDPAKEANLAARKGPYLELESANAVKPDSLYLPAVIGSYALTDGYVLADMYKVTKNAKTGKQVGMPILYYKANKLKVGNDPASFATNTYNVADNSDGTGFVAAPAPFNGATHPLSAEISSGNAPSFYNAIANPNFPGPPARPYRAESFLLHSAGEDGLYGTMDDMFNFDQDN
ncbi:MAG: type II secretion system GspH family protein [Phycisphaerae bacterium]|nr:type II secretion system GspH family protein [Phycisphaerae bacterium]